MKTPCLFCGNGNPDATNITVLCACYRLSRHLCLVVRMSDESHLAPGPLPYFSFRLTAISESPVATAVNAYVNSDKSESNTLNAARTR